MHLVFVTVIFEYNKILHNTTANGMGVPTMQVVLSRGHAMVREV